MSGLRPWVLWLVIAILLGWEATPLIATGLLHFARKIYFLQPPASHKCMRKGN
jgi:hypothetical protein